VEHLSKIFQSGGLFKTSSLTAVDDINFKLQQEKPSITAVIGESGSGKSTLCNLVLGLLEPTTGKIVYKGKNLKQMSKKDRRYFHRDVQAIFQDPYEIYNPFYKASRILETAIRKLKLTSSRVDERTMIIEALKTVELTPQDILDKYPHQLSGGQRQRLAIARTFVAKPSLIVADEPVSMIDTSLKGGILKTIFRLKEQLNVSFLYITHDLSTAYTISDNIIVLYRGSVVEKGVMDTVIANPRHPYLQMLINSVPTPDPENRWGNSIRFKVETLSERSAINPGCKFHNRCLKAIDKCAIERPINTVLSIDHEVNCHLYSE